MKYALIQELISYIELFEKEHSSNTIEDFIIWLNNILFSSELKASHPGHDKLHIAFKLLYLNKELKKQTKKILSASKVSSIDEYSFLLHLNYQESYRKMEIIELHNLEAPTGIEIIKRLLRNKLIVEFEDKEDKRAKRIKITPLGIVETELIKPKIDLIFKQFSAALNLNEKIQINGILDKLIQQ